MRTCSAPHGENYEKRLAYELLTWSNSPPTGPHIGIPEEVS